MFIFLSQQLNLSFIIAVVVWAKLRHIVLGYIMPLPLPLFKASATLQAKIDPENFRRNEEVNMEARGQAVH